MDIKFGTWKDRRLNWVSLSMYFPLTCAREIKQAKRKWDARDLGKGALLSLRAFFASRFTARMQVTILEPG